jgi:beta-phosphoglucomutase
MRLLASDKLQPSSSLQAVVFDMDGVIVDSHPAHRYAWKKFLQAFGKEACESELDFVMDGRKREDIMIHFLGPLTKTQLEDYGHLKNELFWQAASEVVPIPGVFEFIEHVYSAGITLAVATSASASRTQSILSRMGLLTRFRAVVTGNEVSKGKPDPAIYRLACERINCPPSAAVAVEDAASGIRAAKNAGLRCVGIVAHNTGDQLRAAGADCVLQDFVDMSIQRLHFLLGMHPATVSQQTLRSLEPKPE